MSYIGSQYNHWEPFYFVALSSPTQGALKMPIQTKQALPLLDVDPKDNRLVDEKVAARILASASARCSKEGTWAKSRTSSNCRVAGQSAIGFLPYMNTFSAASVSLEVTNGTKTKYLSGRYRSKTKPQAADIISTKT
jgi:hypothetical protein